MRSHPEVRPREDDPDGTIILDQRKAHAHRDALRMEVGTSGGNPEALPPWYFHPGRTPYSTTQSREEADKFRGQLQARDPRLDISWHPLRHRWQVWRKDPEVRSEWCRGWHRMFMVEHQGLYCPLDERVFWALYAFDVERWGGFRKYFSRVEEERKRDADKKEAALNDERDGWVDGWWDHKRPQVGYGTRNNGSKVATHDFGD